MERNKTPEKIPLRNRPSGLKGLAPNTQFTSLKTKQILLIKFLSVMLKTKFINKEQIKKAQIYTCKH